MEALTLLWHGIRNFGKCDQVTWTELDRNGGYVCAPGRQGCTQTITMVQLATVLSVICALSDAMAGVFVPTRHVWRTMTCANNMHQIETRLLA